METETPKKHSSKRKPTLVEFLGKQKRLKAQRIDAKYPNEKMKQREYQDRKNKGYIHRVFCGDKKELFLYLTKCCVALHFTHNPLQGIKFEIEETLKDYNLTKTVSMDRLDFRLYYFQKRDNMQFRKPFELYLRESKFQEAEIVWKKIRFLYSPSKFSYNPEKNKDYDKPKFY